MGAISAAASSSNWNRLKSSVGREMFKPGSIFSISLSLDCEACKTITSSTLVKVSLAIYTLQPMVNLNLNLKSAALDIKWEKSEVHVAGDRWLREQGHIHQHGPVILGWQQQQFRTIH